jgi:ferric-dicitrate binding protein FerR (iron transport regulator)
MRPEQHRLITELLSSPEIETRRQATLTQGRRVLRHRRWRRGLFRAGCVAAAAAAFGVWFHPQPPRPDTAQLPRGKEEIQSLTDTQLLALFPDTPVALANIGGRKVLIFPRPADQKRFQGNF